MGRRRLDRPGTARIAWLVLLVLLASSVMVQFAVEGEAHFDVERWPGGMVLVGAIAAAAVVLAARLVGALLGRGDDFHDDDDR